MGGSRHLREISGTKNPPGDVGGRSVMQIGRVLKRGHPSGQHERRHNGRARASPAPSFDDAMVMIDTVDAPLTRFPAY